MPKKAKVNKLARMSDEERARYLQHRADMEEEARRRKRELIARFIKNKLDKEEAFSRMNTAKLNQTWRYILRKIKCKQMELVIKGTMNSFNFLMERKDRFIQSLMRAIQDSDEQHRRAFQTHTETLSYFIGIGSERLEKLQNKYETQKNNLLDTWDKEHFDITGNQDRAEFKLQLIIFIQNNDFQKYNKEKELLFATAKNDARLEHEEDLNELRRPKELEIEYYWSCLRKVYNGYLEKHNPYIDHYRSLQEKDAFYQRDIARHELQIEHVSESLLTLQKEWTRNTMIMDYKLKKLSKQKEQLCKRYRQLKNASKLEQNSSSERLTNMVNVSQDVVKKFEELKNKLHKILQMAEFCAKYEKEDDKFPDVSSVDEPIETKFENLNNAMEIECKEYNKMDKFFLKMNRVKVQSMCLKAEKAKLAKENINLKNYIKRYLTELALKNERDRPLSVKMQSDVKKLQGPSTKLNRPVTCIEGVLSNAVLHEKRMNLLQKRNKEMGGIQSFPRTHCWTQAS